MEEGEMSNTSTQQETPSPPKIHSLRASCPQNLSELIAVLINIQMKKRNGDTSKIILSGKDLEIMIRVLTMTRTNVLNHGRTAIDAKETIESSSSGITGRGWLFWRGI